MLTGLLLLHWLRVRSEIAGLLSGYVRDPPSTALCANLRALWVHPGFVVLVFCELHAALHVRR